MPLRNRVPGEVITFSYLKLRSKSLVVFSSCFSLSAASNLGRSYKQHFDYFSDRGGLFFAAVFFAVAGFLAVFLSLVDKGKVMEPFSFLGLETRFAFDD